MLEGIYSEAREAREARENRCGRRKFNEAFSAQDKKSKRPTETNAVYRAAVGWNEHFILSPLQIALTNFRPHKLFHTYPQEFPCWKSLSN